MRDFHSGRLWLLVVAVACPSSLFYHGDSAKHVVNWDSTDPNDLVVSSSTVEGIEQRDDGSRFTHSPTLSMAARLADAPPEDLARGLYAVPTPREPYQQLYPHYDIPRSSLRPREYDNVQGVQGLGFSRRQYSTHIYDTPKPGVRPLLSNENWNNPTRRSEEVQPSSPSQPPAATYLSATETRPAGSDPVEKRVHFSCYNYSQEGVSSPPRPSPVEQHCCRTSAGTSAQEVSTEAEQASAEESPTLTEQGSSGSKRTVCHVTPLRTKDSYKKAGISGSAGEGTEPLLKMAPTKKLLQAECKKEFRRGRTRCPLFSKSEARKLSCCTGEAETGSLKGSEKPSCKKKAPEETSSAANEAPKNILLARRELPPLPTEALLCSENQQQTREQVVRSSGGSRHLAELDQRIRETLSTRVLNAVLLLERRFLKALHNGAILDSLTSTGGAEQFAFFAHVAARFTDGLKLTPPEHLFIMWAQECPKISSRCSLELLIEMASLFEFIAGGRTLEVPSAVKVLLNSGGASAQGSSNAAFRPIPARQTGGGAPSHVPFTLFFHRITTDRVRRKVEQDLACSWSQFAGEVRILIYNNHIKKGLDYAPYRTRFLVYTYSAAALKLTERGYLFPQLGADPVETVLNECCNDINLARRISDPDVRNRFLDATRVTHF